jgi:hypothetical protein
VIFDEEYGSRIARRLGLASFSVRFVGCEYKYRYRVSESSHLGDDR